MVFTSIDEFVFSFLIPEYEKNLEVGSFAEPTTPISLAKVDSILCDTFMGYTDYAKSYVATHKERIYNAGNIIIAHKEKNGIKVWQGDADMLYESLFKLVLYTIEELKAKHILLSAGEFFAACSNIVKNTKKDDFYFTEDIEKKVV